MFERARLPLHNNYSIRNIFGLIVPNREVKTKVNEKHQGCGKELWLGERVVEQETMSKMKAIHENI